MSGIPLKAADSVSVATGSTVEAALIRPRAGVASIGSQRITHGQFRIGFNGVTAADAPIVVQLLRGVQSAAGTNVPIEFVKKSDEYLGAVGLGFGAVAARGHTWTGTPKILDQTTVHPSTRDVLPVAFGDGFEVDSGEALGIRLISTTITAGPITAWWVWRFFE